LFKSITKLQRGKNEKLERSSPHLHHKYSKENNIAKMKVLGLQDFTFCVETEET